MSTEDRDLSLLPSLLGACNEHARRTLNSLVLAFAFLGLYLNFQILQPNRAKQRYEALDRASQQLESLHGHLLSLRSGFVQYTEQSPDQSTPEDYSRTILDSPDFLKDSDGRLRECLCHLDDLFRSRSLWLSNGTESRGPDPADQVDKLSLFDKELRALSEIEKNRSRSHPSDAVDRLGTIYPPYETLSIPLTSQEPVITTLSRVQETTLLLSGGLEVEEIPTIRQKLQDEADRIKTSSDADITIPHLGTQLDRQAILAVLPLAVILSALSSVFASQRLFISIDLIDKLEKTFAQELKPMLANLLTTLPRVIALLLFAVLSALPQVHWMVRILSALLLVAFIIGHLPLRRTNFIARLFTIDKDTK